MIRRLDTRGARASTAVRARRSTARPRAVDPDIRRRGSPRSSPTVRAARRRRAARLHRALRPGVELRADELAVSPRPSSRPPSALGAGHGGRARATRRARIERFHAAALPALLAHDATSTARCSARRCGRSTASACYVPGGRAAYPSTVLMTAVPGARGRRPGDRARLAAGPPTGAVPAAVLAAARIAGVTEAYRVGRRAGRRRARLRHRDHPARGQDRGPRQHLRGARQAPGLRRRRHRHGRRAERGRRRRRSHAPIRPASPPTCWRRPSTIRWRAPCCLTDDGRRSSTRVAAALDAPAASAAARGPSPRARSAANGALVVTRDLEEAVDVANRLAPEHLELLVADPGRAGCRGSGTPARSSSASHTPEVVGDYVAGPNHVLPTGGTARFASALGTRTS